MKKVLVRTKIRLLEALALKALATKQRRINVELTDYSKMGQGSRFAATILGNCGLTVRLSGQSDTWE